LRLAAAAGLGAAALAGGCTDSSQLAQDILTGGTSTGSATDLMAKLGETLAQPEIDLFADSTDSRASTVAPAFGEDSSLYAGVPFEDIGEDPLGDELVPGAVARGGLTGEFLNDDPAGDSFSSPGDFRGRWFSSNGDLDGLLRGRYHPLPPDDVPPGLVGAGVFEGRFADPDGRVHGLLRGRYGRDRDGRSLFFGRWLDRHDRLIGLLRGHWEDIPDSGGGEFRGHWAAFNLCREIESSLPGEEGSGDAELEAALEALVASDVDPDAAFEDQPPLGDPNEPPVFEEPDVRLHNGPPCVDPTGPHGFLRGWHRPIPPDPNHPDVRRGVLRARWHSANGRISGHLFGHYAAHADAGLAPGGDEAGVPDGGQAEIDPQPTVAAEGEPPLARTLGVFRFRYENRSGEIRGYAHGEYGVSANGVGVFRGRYFSPDGEPRGIIRGRWDNVSDRPGGPLFGVWAGMDFGDDGELVADRGTASAPRAETRP
jgi:hypothetical protein